MIVVRKANKNDIPLVVKIHLDRFSSFFLTSLGEYFLANFYKAFLKKPGLLLIIEDDEDIKGFAAGSYINNGFLKKIIFNNFMGFAISGIKIFLSKPSALKRIAFNANKSEKNDLNFAELLSIATQKNNKGYGKLLLLEFEKQIALNDSKLPISLTTDFKNNDKAIHFYKNAGYKIFEIFESYENRKMIRFIK